MADALRTARARLSVTSDFQFPFHGGRRAVNFTNVTPIRIAVQRLGPRSVSVLKTPRPTRPWLKQNQLLATAPASNRNDLRRFYPRLAPLVRIILLHRGKQVLPSFSGNLPLGLFPDP